MSCVLMSADRMNTTNNWMGDDQGGQQRNSNVDNGDLSAWEYLTATFDDEHLFALDHTTIGLSDGATNQYHHDRSATANKNLNASTLTLSDTIFYGGLSDTNNSSLGMTTHKRYPDLLQNKQFFHHSFERGTHIQQIDPTNLRVESWSQQMLRNQNELPPSGTAKRRHEYVELSNQTYEPIMIPNIPAHHSMSFSERTERAKLTTGQLDIKESYQHYNSIPYEYTQNNRLAFNTLNMIQENDTNLDEYVRLKSATKRSSHVNHFDTSNESFPSTVFDSMYTSSKQSIPPNKKLKFERKKTNDDTIVTNEVKSYVNAETSYSSTLQSASSTNKMLGCFSPMEEQQIHNWVTLQGPSMVPPYQQLCNKKLLLAPLTPYNYFFRDERDNIVSQISTESDPLPHPISECSVLKLQNLLYQHWFIDPVKRKRQHRKSHGKINFQRLSKVIAERWHILPKNIREFYRAVARHDDIYYHQQLEIIKQRPDIVS